MSEAQFTREVYATSAPEVKVQNYPIALDRLGQRSDLDATQPGKYLPLSAISFKGHWMKEDEAIGLNVPKATFGNLMNHRDQQTRNADIRCCHGVNTSEDFR